jgi:hypothetical protein
MADHERVDDRRLAFVTGPVDEGDVAVQFAFVERARNRCISPAGPTPSEASASAWYDHGKEVSMLHLNPGHRAIRQRPDRRSISVRGYSRDSESEHSYDTNQYAPEHHGLLPGQESERPHTPNVLRSPASTSVSRPNPLLKSTYSAAFVPLPYGMRPPTKLRLQHELRELPYAG